MGLGRDRRRQQLLRVHEIVQRPAVEEVDGAQRQLVRGQVFGPLRSRSPELDLPEMRHRPLGNLDRYAVLQLEDVDHRPLETVGPDHVTGLGFGQLRVEPQAGFARMHAAGQDIANTEHLGDVARLVKAIAKRRRRQAGRHVQVRQARQVRDDVLGNEVAQEVVARIAGQVAKRQHRDRRPVADAAAAVGRARRQRTRRPDAKCAHLPVEALQLALAEVLDDHAESVRELVAHGRRYDDLVRPAQVAQPRSQIDALAVDVEFVGDDVGDVHAHAEANADARLQRGLPLRHPGLDGDCALDGPDGALEFGQHAVALQLHAASPELRQVHRRDRGHQFPPPRDGACLVEAHDPHRVDHVDEQHGTQAASGLCLQTHREGG